uniref:Uncharacterized protein n=1 Tax=Panagrolaimus davidi TaxID=227884 RepID=A0A914QSV7_9BILA
MNCRRLLCLALGLSKLLAAVSLGPVNYITIDQARMSNIVYPQHLIRAINAVHPIKQDMYSVENKVFKLTTDYTAQNAADCGSKYLDYIILAAEVVLNGQLTFKKFVNAAVYKGKGEGVRPFGHLKDLEKASLAASKKKATKKSSVSS